MTGASVAEALAVYPPESAPDATAEEKGRHLFAQACDFVAGAATDAALPVVHLPELAFAGRSNVGKSSLVNALTGRRTLARVSHTPGRTQQLNFFSLSERLMLVDLPGYGFAQASKAKAAGWTKLMERYLKGRPNLRRVMLLIDARYGLKEVDRSIMAMLDEAAVSYQIVLTKIDKVPRSALERCAAATAAELVKHVAAHPTIHLTSAHDKLGIAPLRAAIAALAS